MVEGLQNARDLGGLPLVVGGRTPHGVFFRSESLHTVTPAGWQQLHALGIRTVVDLRQPVERDARPYESPEWMTVRYVDHDGLDDNPSFWADYRDNGLVGTALYFLPHLEHLPERSAAALSALAQAPEGGVLFHCAGGRDRTGIIALLLLAIVGAERDAIIEDYMESVRNGAALAAAQGRPDAEATCEQICQRHGTTTEGAFREAVAQLDPTPVLSLLTHEEHEAIRTWRGGLTGVAPVDRRSPAI
ncbi:tyrosine-protein phosphatase [Nocardioides sp. Kera G14]|uniref:tyrosine-protein phosphatase n=1 Tax=Nocardioides sp. Kera G14 TaxID=2884264 RepID=UPI001D10088B|nr:tyrosine-protein phosphatase [Nocardioides sp. Kera G14]UDY24039.1 tyrosine-protein phosphatase [Nocardioides sp. Kera G14]